MIIFDMEWNSGMYDPIQLDEILQIGAVKVEGPGGPILDTFNVYIRPQVHPRYSPAAAQLPDLSLSLKSHLDFPAAFEQFMIWCGDDDDFAAWGGNDLTVLRRNRDFWKLYDPLPTCYIDLQRAFCNTVGAANSLSLERALEYCGAPDIFDPHNALYDAVYTWTVCQPLPQSALDGAVCDVTLTKKPPALPKRQSPWKGGFRTVTDLLNSRAFRRGTCPRCGAQSRITKWYPASSTLYYAPFTCSCGRPYYLRLETRKRKDLLWGNAEPVRAAGKHRAFFDEHLKDKTPVECRPLRRRRTRRRPDHKKPA